jgi:hypothetical protein
VSDCCLTPNEQLVNNIMNRTVIFQRDDDNVCFVLDQHAIDYITIKKNKEKNTSVASMLASSAVDSG